MYRCQVKHTLKPLKDFDPRPAEYQGRAPQQLEKFKFKKVQGKGLGISLLLDKDVQIWKATCDKSDKNKIQVQILIIQLSYLHELK